MTISVTQLGNFLKAMVDSEVLLYDLNVEGEISNYRRNSEVAFFVLKDSNARIDCFCYNPPAINLEEGAQITVSGKPNYYVKGGKLSFLVTKITKKDVKGEKFRELMLLKERLEKEGLFDELKKKPINTNCKKIGVVTSAEGAVIHDIINVCRRRNPTVDISVYDCRVQGIYSENSIIRGLKYFDNSNVDNIIIARGGGSNEDLASFNGEKLVYAISLCKKPVISAVGHETNFTLCDFVADCRASTPSVAAELCTQNIGGVIDDLFFRLNRQYSHIYTLINEKKNRVFSSENLLTEKYKNLFYKYSNEISLQCLSLQSLLKNKLTNAENTLGVSIAKLGENNPTKILEKGFSVVKDKDNTVKSVKQVKQGQKLDVIMSDGTLGIRVENVEVKK